MIGTAIDPIQNPVAVDTLRASAERLQQAPKGRITLQVHTLDFQQLRGRGPWLGDESRRQSLVHRQHHRVCQSSLIGSLGTAGLFLVTQPQLPLGLPLTTLFPGMHRQQGVGIVTLGCAAQGRRISTFQIRRGGDDLFVQVRQWQTQGQTTVLRGAAQGCRTGLAIAHQACTLGVVVQPPAQYRRPIGTPHCQPGPAQRLVGGARVKVDFQHFRRAGLEAVLADDLLRVFANRRQPGILWRLGIAGQAQDQRIERPLCRFVTLLR
ncbi:hypothetical protein D3C84_681820 [compost metagenome]